MEANSCISLVLNLILLSVLLLSSSSSGGSAFAADTLSKGRNITDNETLVSADGSFTMGFFSPGASTKRYLGIWFSVSRDAVCWVANRDHPVPDNSSVLVLSDTGSLLLLYGPSGQIAWSSNSSIASRVEAQLLDSGNLVMVRNRGSTNFLWQSFDSPSNVLLAGMKVGVNLWDGSEWSLTSWRSADDPSPGAFRRVLDVKGRPDNMVWQGDVKVFRTGPWNGLRFGGIPEVLSYSNLIEYQMLISPREITFGYSVKPGMPFNYVVLTETGVVKRLVWDASGRTWQTYYQGPRDICDAYGKCGAFGVCNSSAASTSFCSCLRGFSPASPSEWTTRTSSGGCRRTVKLDCDATRGATTDGFVLVHSVKLPDTHNASVDTSIITLQECRARCLANCSCLAYAGADIQGGGVPTGCILWTHDIMDLRYVDRGQDLFLRLANSELPPLPPPSSPQSSRQFPMALVVGASSATTLVLVLGILSVLVTRKRRRRPPIPGAHFVYVHFSTSFVGQKEVCLIHTLIRVPAPHNILPNNPAWIVPSIELHQVQEATGNFANDNVIGQGGFGVVYKVPPPLRLYSFF